MLRLTERRRAVLAEKFGDLANFAVVALLFEQALNRGRISLALALAGAAIWLGLMTASYLLAGDSQ